MKTLQALSAMLAAFVARNLVSWGEFGPQETYFGASAVADLTSFQYRVMRFTGKDLVNVASHALSADAAELPSGILQNNPSSGGPATVAYQGYSKARAGAQIAVNELVTTNGSGKVIEAVSGSIVIGRAMEAAGAEDEICTVLLFPPMRIGSVA